MTAVSLAAFLTELVAPGRASGSVTIEYWAGSRPYVNVAGEDVVFPGSIRVPITDGAPVKVLDLPPTGGACCVRWTVEVRGSSQRVRRYTTIPDVAEVAFGDLVDVDPDGFAPVDPPPMLLDAIQQIVHDLTYDRY